MKLFLLTLLSICLFSNDVHGNTDIQVTVQSSNVANLYYQIYGNNQPIEKDLDFYLIDNKGNKYDIKTKESILYLKNVPFGTYELILINKPFSYQLTIDQQYLKTQHKLKRIDIYYNHSTPNTSDHENIEFYLSLLGITSLFIFLIFYK